MPNVEPMSEPENLDHSAAIRRGEVHGLEVREWHPLQDGRGKPEQVHVIVHAENFGDVVIPLQGAKDSGQVRCRVSRPPPKRLGQKN